MHAELKMTFKTPAKKTRNTNEKRRSASDEGVSVHRAICTGVFTKKTKSVCENCTDAEKQSHGRSLLRMRISSSCLHA